MNKKEKRAIQSKKKRKERDIPVCLHCAFSRTAPGLELASYQRKRKERKKGKERETEREKKGYRVGKKEKRAIQRKKRKERDIEKERKRERYTCMPALRILQNCSRV